MRGYVALSILLGTIFLLTTPSVEAQTPGIEDCIIDTSEPHSSNTSPEKTYVAVKNVTTVGHYDGGPYKLWCQDSWYEELGSDIAFTYVSGGHVRDANITPDYPNEQSLGTNIQCRVTTGGCKPYNASNPSEPFEVCVFNMNNPNDAHVADCNDANVPMPNSYSHTLCCEVQEACHDGKDNTLNGYMDCADPQCHAATPEPGICNYNATPDNRTNANNQSTADCVANPSQCEGPGGSTDRYYCGYGSYDDPSVEEMGVCCPQGTSPQYDAFKDEWSCDSNDKCGVGGTSKCDYDIEANESGYFGEVYDGDATDYCVSEVPDLYQADEMQSDNSAACCEVPRYGETDYWFKDSNVQVYG